MSNNPMTIEGMLWALQTAVDTAVKQMNRLGFSEGEIRFFLWEACEDAIAKIEEDDK